MNDAPTVVLDRSTTDCVLCRRSVLYGEPLIPFVDARSDRPQAVCELCRPRAAARGWEAVGEPVRRSGPTRLRVEERPALTIAPAAPAASTGDDAAGAPAPRPLLAPEAGVLERMIGLEAHVVDPEPPAELMARLRRSKLEIDRLRRELDPARRAEERRQAERNVAEIRQLRAALRERDTRIERLEHARHAETSPMRMSGHALHAFNQSGDLERMARIARTLGEPVVNVHDEGPGIPRRVRVTLSWDIAWYEFTVKLDLGAGRASVHETGSGGEPTVLPLERRRRNAAWSDSGLKLT